MKNLINLIALVILVSTNVLTPFSYAQDALLEVIPENEVENIEEAGETPEISEEISELDPEEKGEIEKENLDDEMIEDVELIISGDALDNGGGIESLDNSTLSQIEDLNVMKSDNPIEILRGGDVVSTYIGLSGAINAAESGDVINIVKDISVTEASVLSGKSLIINGNNHIITRGADITMITVNEGSSLRLIDVTITDNAENFAPNRYDALLRNLYQISLCLGGVNETKNESGDVTASACATENVDVAKTHPQIYSVGDIYGDNLTISNSLNSKGSAAIIVEKGGIEMVNSNFIHNGASGTNNAGRGGAIRVGPNTATNIVDESPITKILFSGCYFENNYSRNLGGALAIHYAPEVITIDNCIFSGNTAHMNGGAIHVPSINSTPTGKLPSIPNESLMPIGVLYINDSVFYNNRCGNDGAAIENDDMHLQIDLSKFEHNYGTQPQNQSIGVVACQAGGGSSVRGLTLREYKIYESDFKDTNTVVLGDHNSPGYFYVDNSSFENQDSVLLSYNGIGKIKNSKIKNSNPNGNCGLPKRLIYDFAIGPYLDHIERINIFGEDKMKFELENNTYINDCNTNEYFQIHNENYSTGVEKFVLINEENTRILVHRRRFDSASIEGTNEVYYGASVDDGKFAYLKKDKFYDFDGFNFELKKLSYSNSEYQLQSGKTMLFYLDNGYTELWSGSISTTTSLYGREANIYNITYEGMDGLDFEGITHTYKFNNLIHTQYLTELTPYTLNEPSRNGYRFEGWFLDSGYILPVTTIETGATGDIILYAKWTKIEDKSSGNGYSGGGGSSKSDTKKEEQKPVDSVKVTQNDNSTSSGANVKDSEGVTLNDFGVEQSEGQSNNKIKVSDNSYTNEQKEAYEFAKQSGITTMPTIQKAQMNSKLTRIAMAKMLSQYAINVLGKEPDFSRGVVNFNDVTTKMDRQYDNGVILAYQLGIMGQNMPNNKFRPNDEVTRAEFATALSRMLYNTSDGEYKSTPKYYIHHMEKLVKEGIITKDDPNMKELRGYVMIMLMRSDK